MVAFGIEPKRRALNSSEDEPRDSTLIYSCTCGASTSIGWRSVNHRQPRWSFMLPLRGGLIISTLYPHIPRPWIHDPRDQVPTSSQEQTTAPSKDRGSCCALAQNWAGDCQV